MKSAVRWFGLASVAAAVLAAVGYAAWRDIANQLDRGSGVRAIRDTVDAVAEAETSQRGYLLTRQTIYRDYHAASVKKLEALRPAWSPSVGKKLAELDATIRLADKGKWDEAVAIVEGGAGRDMMQVIRLESEKKIVAGRIAFRAWSERLLVAIPVAGISAFIVIGGCLAAIVLEGSAKTRAVQLAAESRLKEREANHAARNSQQAVIFARAELADRNRYFNAVSHDLRTPMQAVVYAVFDCRMSLGADMPAAVVEALDEIEAQMGTAANYLESILQAARSDDGSGPKRCEPYDLGELVAEVFATFHGTADRKGILLLNRAAGIACSSHRSSVKRIVQNLVGNAVKFTPQGKVTVSALKNPWGTAITVRDTGPGIAPDMIPTLFGEFVQASNPERDATKGFGLGLSIVKGLAKSLGGDIEVDSKVGRGTAFTVTVPE